MKKLQWTYTKGVWRAEIQCIYFEVARLDGRPTLYENGKFICIFKRAGSAKQVAEFMVSG